MQLDAAAVEEGERRDAVPLADAAPGLAVEADGAHQARLGSQLARRQALAQPAQQDDVHQHGAA